MFRALHLPIQLIRGVGEHIFCYFNLDIVLVNTTIHQEQIREPLYDLKLGSGRRLTFW